MKKRRKGIPSVYDKAKFKEYKKKGFTGNFLFIVVLVVILLIIVRFANLYMQYHMTKLELKSSSLCKEIDFNFLGLSGYEKARKRLLQSDLTQTKKIKVVCFYDLFYPAVFFINNKDKLSFVDLGKLVVYVDSGLSVIYFYQFDVIKSKVNETEIVRSFGNSLVFPIFRGVCKILGYDLNIEKRSKKDISYIIKSTENFKYLKTPYLLYFYIPLLLIILFAFFYSNAIFISFLYYIEIFFLFDLKEVFVVPFSWLLNFLNIQASDMVVLVGTCSLCVLFLIAGILGLFNWKNIQNQSFERGFILFMLLLPIFIRF